MNTNYLRETIESVLASSLTVDEKADMVQEIYYSFPVKEHLQLDSDFFKMTILGLKETDFDSYLNHIALSAMRSKKKISFWKIMDHFEVLSKNYQAPKIVPVGAYVRNEMLKKRA